MSKTVDDRIVRMSFDTAKFQNGVKGVLEGLKSIDKSLIKERTFKGLDGISKSISNVTSKGMGDLAGSIDNAAGRFSALEVAGITALSNISNRAVNAGLNLVKSLTLDPVMDGFGEYELKMDSIGTILTNTAAHGTTLNDVNAALQDLNEYSDKTIYNFAQMTDNIGKATAAGLELGPAVDFVKGMANTAAAFGVNATSMAGATQQMTQALASGVVKAQDWMSMENAGMAGKLLQDKLIENAKAAGKSIDLVGTSFKGSLEQGWLTAEIFSETMAQMANDDTFTKKAGEVTSLTKLIGVLGEAVGSGWATTFESILGGKDASTKLFTDINDAITNGLINPMTEAREAVVQTWLKMDGRENTIKAFSNIWENLSRILGPIGQAFSDIFPSTFGTTLGNITKGFLALTESLMISEEFSGFIGDAFKGLFSILNGGIKIIGFVLQPLKHVFDFLSSIGGVLGSAVVAFIRMFYVFGDYVRELTIVKQAQELFAKSFEFLGKLGDKFVKAFNKATKGIQDFFKGVTNALNSLFGASDKSEEASQNVDKAGDSADKAGKKFDGVKTVSDMVTKGFDAMKKAGEDIQTMFNNAKKGAEDVVSGFKTFLSNLKEYILNSGPIVRATEMMTEAWETMCGVGDKIKGFVQSIDFSPITNTINAIKNTLAPVVTFISNIFKTVTGAFKSMFDELDLTGGQFIALMGGFAAGFGVFKILGKIGDIIGNFFNPVNDLKDSAVGVLDGIKGVLEAYQNDIKADVLKKIGVAVLMLSGALLILSQLEMGQVQAGLLGVVGILVSVVGSLALLIGITQGADLKGFFSLTAAFITLSMAVMNISVAIMLLSSLGMDGLATGLLGVAGSMTMLVLALGAVGTMTGPIVKGAMAMYILSAALGNMYIALTLFSKMDTSQMNNSLMSVGMALGVLVLACKGLNAVTGNIPKTALGLILLSTALILLVTACRKFGELDTGVLIQGLSTVTVLIGALSIFSKSTANSKLSFTMGAGMMGMAKALSMLYKPIEKFGKLKVSELAKGITSLSLVMAGLTLLTNTIKPKSGFQLIQVSMGLVVFAKAVEMFCKTAVRLKNIDMGDMVLGLVKIGLAVSTLSLALSIIPEAKMAKLAGGMILMSGAFIILTKAIEKSGNIQFGTMAKGFIALAGGLLILEGACRLTPASSLFALGGGLIVISAGFRVMATAVEKLGALDLAVIAKGLGSMLGMVGIMSLMNMGMMGMSLPALALGIGLMAVALTALTLPIKMLGSLELQTIGIGLLAIAGVLAVLGIAGALMTPIVPVLLALGSAISLLGTGMLTASGGMVLFSGGFAILSTTLALFGDELLAFFVAFGEKLPTLVESVGLAFVTLLQVIGQNAPTITTSLYQIFTSILDAVIMVIPLAANAVTTLIVTILNTLTSNVGRLVEAGVNLIMGLLDGLNTYVGPVTSKMIEVLTTMAFALGENVIILVDAGIRLVIELINGIAQGIESNSDAFSDAVMNLIFSVLDAMVDLGSDFFKRGTGFVGELISGFFGREKEVKDTSTNVAKSGVSGAESTNKEWKAAGHEFSNGVARGIENGRSGVVSAATSVARDAANAIKSELDINSPSKVTTEFGMWTSKGLAGGISAFGHLASRAGTEVARDTAESISRPLNNIALLDGVNIDPVVKPVMDLSNIKSGSRTIGEMLTNAAGTISSFGSLSGNLAANVGQIQNRNNNEDVVKAISKLRRDIGNIQGVTNIIDGITYDNGSAIRNTIGDLVRIAKVERRK